jgi:hypothetical protein
MKRNDDAARYRDSRQWFLYIEFEIPAGVTYQVETVVGLRYFTVCKPEIVQK